MRGCGSGHSLDNGQPIWGWILEENSLSSILTEELLFIYFKSIKPNTYFQCVCFEFNWGCSQEPTRVRSYSQEHGHLTRGYTTEQNALFSPSYH